MRYYHTILAIVGLLLPCANFVQASNGGSMPQEAEQVLFILDDSSSMTETAFDPNEPKATRWEVLQRVFPQWL